VRVRFGSGTHSIGDNTVKYDRIKEHRRCLSVSRRFRKYATDTTAKLGKVPENWNMSQSEYSGLWARESVNWFNRAIQHRRCYIAEKNGSTVWNG